MTFPMDCPDLNCRRRRAGHALRLPLLAALVGFSLASLPALAQATTSPPPASGDVTPSATATETPARQSAPAQANEASGHDSQTGKPETGPESTGQGSRAGDTGTRDRPEPLPSDSNDAKNKR